MSNYNECQMIQVNRHLPQPVTAKPDPERLLALPEVEERTGLKKTSLYGLIRDGKFPPPIRLTRRASRWPASQVQAWIADRIQAGAV